MTIQDINRGALILAAKNFVRDPERNCGMIPGLKTVLDNIPEPLRQAVEATATAWAYKVMLESDEGYFERKDAV